MASASQSSGDTPNRRHDTSFTSFRSCDSPLSTTSPTPPPSPSPSVSAIDASPSPAVSLSASVRPMAASENGPTASVGHVASNASSARRACSTANMCAVFSTYLWSSAVEANASSAASSARLFTCCPANDVRERCTPSRSSSASPVRRGMRAPRPPVRTTPTPVTCGGKKRSEDGASLVSSSRRSSTSPNASALSDDDPSGLGRPGLGAAHSVNAASIGAKPSGGA
mmetsp:Transcript_16780/g.58655  ORF Transcript_16780/g.58655 Transcript_16780/m.58655 type:complete len:226 (+) Transcript_16780:6360-7037(+)